MAERISSRPSAFSATRVRGIRDTLALNTSQGSQETSSDTSSVVSTILELTRAEETQIKRSSALFAPVQPRENGDSDERSGSFLDSWRPSTDLMAAVDGSTRPQQTEDWNDDGLEVTPEGSHPKLDIIPSHVRGSTPDSVASSGNIRIRNETGNYTDINPVNLRRTDDAQRKRILQSLAATTRGLVLQFDRLEDTQDGATGINFQMTVTGQERETQSPKTEKKRKFAPRAILLALFLATLIGAVVALIVAVPRTHKESKKEGNIIPDPIGISECKDKVFNLGDKFYFECDVADHEYRRGVKNASFFRVSKHNQASDGSEPIRYNYSRNSKVIYGPNGTVNCSTEGIYNVTFYSSNESTSKIELQEGYKLSLKVTVNYSTVDVTFKQRLSNNCPKTEFVATCSISGDCNHYQPKLFRKIYDQEDDLTHLARCISTFNDTAGNTFNCSATIPEDLLGNVIQLGCRMQAQLDDGRTQETNKLFLLPKCGIKQECSTYLGIGPGPFNCSSKSTHIERLNNATCDFEVLENCFDDRPIFSYFKNATRGITCDNKAGPTIPVCRLGWCRNYQYINKLEIPGVAICGSGYSEPEALVPSR